MSGIIFDLDDTLYNERTFVSGGFKAVSSFISEKYSLPEDDLNQRINDIFNSSGRGSIFNELCRFYGLDENIPMLVDVYRTSEPPLELYSDAKLFLEDFSNTNHKLGLITDGLKTVQWNKIKLLGIETFLDEIIVTDDYGSDCWKPSQFGYLHFCKKQDLTPEECVYIGDNEHKDFVTAKKLGMKAVRIRRSAGDHKDFEHDDERYRADATIGSFDELPGVLKEWGLL